MAYEYTVYDREGQVIAFGTARECAKAMGLKITSFRPMAWRYMTGKIGNTFHNYTFIREGEVPTVRPGGNGRPRRPCAAYDVDTGEFVAAYPSITQAARSIYKGNQAGISNCLRGIYKTSGGYVWKYYDGEA